MTAEELLQVPRGYHRHELINGELKTMPLFGVPHGRITARLSVPLGNFVSDHDLGEVTYAGFQLTWSPDTVLGPDIAFIAKERLKEVGKIEGYWPGPPDIAVQVLDPGDGLSEQETLSRWFGFATKQVWIVDPKHSTVTVYRSPSDSTKFSGSDDLEAQDLFPGFRLSLDKIFGTSSQEK
jgi:Uma2 family endonuclease